LSQFRLLLLALLYLSLSGWLFSSRAIAKEVVFLTLEYPPYSSEQMPGQGAAVELLRMMLAGTPWTPVVRFVPWARVEHELKAARADGALLLWPEELKRYRIKPTSAIFLSRLGFYVRTEDAPRLDVALSALKGRRVCTVRGYGYPAELSAAGVLLDESSTDTINLQRIVRKRCDYVALERAVGQFILAQASSAAWRQNVSWMEPAFAELPLTFGVMPDKPDAEALLQAMELGLARLQQQQQYQRLLKRYGLDRP